MFTRVNDPPSTQQRSMTSPYPPTNSSEAPQLPTNVHAQSASSSSPHKSSDAPKGCAPGTGAPDISQPRRRQDGSSRGNWRGQGNAGRRGKGDRRGDSSKPQEGPKERIKEDKTNARQSKKPTKGPARPRPTHFLALPLHNHPELRNRISAFQEALFGPLPAPTSSPISTPAADNPVTASTSPIPNDLSTTSSPSNLNSVAKGKSRRQITTSPIVQGLDTSIVIDPRRLHMTLGVMALELDLNDNGAAAASPEDVEQSNFPNESIAESAAEAAQPDLIKPISVVLPNPLVLSSSPSMTSCASTISTTQASIPSIIEASSTISSSKPTRKTISTALALLHSIQPEISNILDGSKGVKVPLGVMDVLKTERIRSSIPVQTPRVARPDHLVATNDLTGDVHEQGAAKRAIQDTMSEDAAAPVDEKVGAGVLFIGPRHASTADKDQWKMKVICDLVYKTFKDAGYLTDTRPLKLHCTILNASHRKPPRRIPFSYSDILSSPACRLLGADPSATSQKTRDILDGNPKFSLASVAKSSANTSSREKLEAGGTGNATKRTYRHPLKVPPPLPVDLGTYDVQEIQLWAMGSHGLNNEYANCGGIVLE